MTRIPEGIDKLVCLGMSTNQRDGCRSSNKSDAVTQCLRIVARTKQTVGTCTIDIVLVHECVEALRIKEVLDEMSVVLLPNAVGTTPRIVESNVHWHTPRVISEGIANEMSVAKQGTIEVVIVGIETSGSIDASMQVFTACACTLLPITAASILCITCPNLIEGRKMIGGISKGNSWNEANKVGSCVDEAHLSAHGNRILQAIPLTVAIDLDFDGLWLDCIKNVLRFAQIVDAGFIAPKVGGEKKRSDIIKFTIAGRTLCIGRTIGLATPTEITLHRPIRHLHILLAPAPKAIEDILATELNGNHQTI